jgi:hypothetical protein
MFNCPRCRAPLPLVWEASCRSCGADLSELDPANLASSRSERAAADRTLAGRAGLWSSILIYVVLIVTSIEARSQSKFAQAFGDRPLGLPLAAFVVGLLTILYLSIPIAFHHLSRIARQAHRDEFGFRGLGALLYFADVHHRHPELSRSRWICLGCLGYFLCVVAAWIIYTAKLGI